LHRNLSFTHIRVSTICNPGLGIELKLTIPLKLAVLILEHSAVQYWKVVTEDNIIILVVYVSKKTIWPVSLAIELPLLLAIVPNSPGVLLSFDIFFSYKGYACPRLESEGERAEDECGLHDWLYDEVV
jgi:hypothetical protein